MGIFIQRLAVAIRGREPFLGGSPPFRRPEWDSEPACDVFAWGCAGRESHGRVPRLSGSEAGSLARLSRPAKEGLGGGAFPSPPPERYLASPPGAQLECSEPPGGDFGGLFSPPPVQPPRELFCPEKADWRGENEPNPKRGRQPWERTPAQSHAQAFHL